MYNSMHPAVISTEEKDETKAAIITVSNHIRVLQEELLFMRRVGKSTSENYAVTLEAYEAEIASWEQLTGASYVRR